MHLYLPLNLAECVARAHQIHLRQMPRRLDCQLNLTCTDDFFVCWRLPSKFVCCWRCYWSYSYWSYSNRLLSNVRNFAKLPPAPLISSSRTCSSSKQRQYAALRVEEGVECLSKSRIRQHLFRFGIRQHTSAHVQHTSAYVSTRQHTPANASKQHAAL